MIVADTASDFAHAALAAGGAALGFLGRTLVDWWKERRTEKATRVARLHRLALLLGRTKLMFELQMDLVHRLMTSITADHADVAKANLGYAATFAAAYEGLSPGRKDDHALIRGMTEFAFHTLNSRMAKWIDDETEFTMETVPLPDGLGRDLADQLLVLDLHLAVWLQRYAMTIPGHPENALVFLADEWKRGVGFPAGIESTVDRAIAALSGREPRTER